MTEHPFRLGINKNPITHNLYSESWNEGIIAPSSPRILITEDGKYITTEDGKYITTEN